MLRYKNSLLERILLEKGKRVCISVVTSIGTDLDDVGNSASQCIVP